MAGSAPLNFLRFYCARKGLAAVGVMLVGVLSGCVPALNWREVRGSQADAVASFPCKPDLHVRQVTLDGLGGARLPMALRVCDADGQTFAMMEVDVQDPARVPAAMKNLYLAFSGNVGALPTSAARQEWAVSGMTPQPDGGRWRFDGAMPSGRSVQAETGLVSRGTVIVQVNVSGPEIAPEAAKQFFESFFFRAPSSPSSASRTEKLADTSSMTTILIMAHAPLASALREVAAHVLPEAAREVLALDVLPEWDGPAVEAASRAVLARAKGAPTLILTDVFGATPCNVAQRLADGQNVRVVTGVNVAMLWRALGYAHEPLEAVVARAVAGGIQGVLQLAPQSPQIQTQTQKPPRHDQEFSDHQQ